ncbi:MAG: hypothetical protein JZU49_00120 [Sulfuricurvum sp.]|nr:hypothetical protein [Sulfuricurvum sp.]
MKNVTIRLDDQHARMLTEIDAKPTTAAQIAIEILNLTRRSTLNELKGVFSREEITAMADSFNGLIPTWKIMCNTSVLVAHTEDAEKYQQSASQHGAKIDELLEKLSKLTAAQAAILQLELVSYWNCEGTGGYGSPSPDLEKLVKMLV